MRGLRFAGHCLSSLVWVGIFLVSLFLAHNARDNLHETNLQIPGTASDRAAKLTQQQFGSSISLAVLLKAPPGQERLLKSESRAAGRQTRANPRASRC